MEIEEGFELQVGLENGVEPNRIRVIQFKRNLSTIDERNIFVEVECKFAAKAFIADQFCEDMKDQDFEDDNA